MRLQKFTPFLVVIILASCSKISTSSEDKKSIEEIQKLYGGSIETNKGIETFNTKSENFIEVIIKDSKFIEKQPQRAISDAGNLAYIVYQNQNKENYDIIKTKIVLPNGTNISKSFSNKELREVKDIYPELENLNSFLISKNYKGILDMFDAKFKPKDKIIDEGLSTMDSKMGQIKDIQFQGFEFLDDANLGHIILFREVAARDNTFPFINVAFDRNTQKLLSIEFP